MCTVTYIPVKDKIFITSNRDEKAVRKKAIPPFIYEYENTKLIFPKDAEAGGTWIAMKEDGNAAVLLNGAFICHVAEPPYRKSRGQIFLDVFAHNLPSTAFREIDLDDIEPFTFVLLENTSLYEFRWDGNEKYCKQLPPHSPHIWSSATLYDGLVVKKREQWFTSFLNNNSLPTQSDILSFHRFTGDGDNNNDLLMSRNNGLSTVSITGMLLTAERGSIKYLDIKEDTSVEKKIEFTRIRETMVN
jgi:uncharacterized protein with NRDE domain